MDKVCAAAADGRAGKLRLGDDPAEFFVPRRRPLVVVGIRQYIRGGVAAGIDGAVARDGKHRFRTAVCKFHQSRRAGGFVRPIIRADLCLVRLDAAVVCKRTFSARLGHRHLELCDGEFGVRLAHGVLIVARYQHAHPVGACLRRQRAHDVREPVCRIFRGRSVVIGVGDLHVGIVVSRYMRRGDDDPIRSPRAFAGQGDGDDVAIRPAVCRDRNFVICQRHAEADAAQLFVGRKRVHPGIVGAVVQCQRHVEGARSRIGKSDLQRLVLAAHRAERQFGRILVEAHQRRVVARQRVLRGAEGHVPLFPADRQHMLGNDQQMMIGKRCIVLGARHFYLDVVGACGGIVIEEICYLFVAVYVRVIFRAAAAAGAIVSIAHRAEL